MLPAIVQNETGSFDPGRPFKRLTEQRTQQLAFQQRSELIEDFHRSKPAFVFVEHCEREKECEIYNTSVNYIGWFSRDPRFATEWTNYTFDKSVAEYDLYRRAVPQNVPLSRRSLSRAPADKVVDLSSRRHSICVSHRDPCNDFCAGSYRVLCSFPIDDIATRHMISLASSLGGRCLRGAYAPVPATVHSRHPSVEIAVFGI